MARHFNTQFSDPFAAEWAHPFATKRKAPSHAQRKDKTGSDTEPDPRDDSGDSPVKLLNATYEGTEGQDFVTLAAFEPMTVHTYGGGDKVSLFGIADYTVDTGAHNDRLSIYTPGKVTAQMGTGDDSVSVRSFNTHVLDGGAGRDQISFEHFGQAVIVDLMQKSASVSLSEPEKITLNGFEDITGSAFDDVIRANHQDNLIGTGGGNDQVFAMGGNDTVAAWSGDNYIDLGSGDDEALTAYGDDIIHGGAGNDQMSSQGGYNQFFTGTGADTVSGGSGNDWVHGGAHGDDASDRFTGRGEDAGMGHFGDTLDYTLADGAVTFNTRLGTVSGPGAGVKVEYADDGSVSLTQMTDTFLGFERYHGSNFNDRFITRHFTTEQFFGGDGDDTFLATSGSKLFDGGDSDLYYSDAPFDAGFDVVDYALSSGSVHADLRLGEGTFSLSNTTFTDGNPDTHKYVDIDGLIGGRGSDVLIGDRGDNLLDGGRGSDDLTGHGGADTFRFVKQYRDSAFDTITDFTHGEDALQLVGHRAAGGRVNAFGDLDTTGDGLLNSDDSTFYAYSNGTGYLFLEGGMIELLGVTEMTADDFLFA